MQSLSNAYYLYFKVLKHGIRFKLLLYSSNTTVFIHIKAPSLLVAPLLLSTFAKFIFRSFTSLSTASTFAIPGLGKKRCVLVLPQSNTAYEK